MSFWSRRRAGEAGIGSAKRRLVRAAMKADMRETALSVGETLALVRRPGAGGLSVFVGVVRDENAGRAVTKLEYSAYVLMAKREMTSIAEEIEKEIDGVRVAAMHRVGLLD